MATGSDGRPAATRRNKGSKSVSAARHLRIPETPAEQLSVSLNWIDITSRGRLGKTLINAVMRHHRAVGTFPGVFTEAAVQYLACEADRQPDSLNRYWTIVNQVSARERSRYLNIEEIELL